MVRDLKSVCLAFFSWRESLNGVCVGETEREREMGPDRMLILRSFFALAEVCKNEDFFSSRKIFPDDSEESVTYFSSFP